MIFYSFLLYLKLTLSNILGIKYTVRLDNRGQNEFVHFENARNTITNVQIL